jgi:hypothetical protein
MNHQWDRLSTPLLHFILLIEVFGTSYVSMFVVFLPFTLMVQDIMEIVVNPVSLSRI